MLLMFRRLLSRIVGSLVPARPNKDTRKSDDVVLRPEAFTSSPEIKPASQGQDLSQYPGLVEAFKGVLDPETPIITLPKGTTLYRGGECKNQSPFPIRRTNIFLTTHASYAKFYTRFRNMLPYRYEYRAITTRSVQLAVVGAMKSVVDVAVEDLGIVKRNAAAIWQRESMIDLARIVLGSGIDGIYFRTDANSDEVLLDNIHASLELEQLDIWPV